MNISVREGGGKEGEEGVSGKGRRIKKLFTQSTCGDYLERKCRHNLGIFYTKLLY